MSHSSKGLNAPPNTGPTCPARSSSRRSSASSTPARWVPSAPGGCRGASVRRREKCRTPTIKISKICFPKNNMRRKIIKTERKKIEILPGNQLSESDTRPYRSGAAARNGGSRRSGPSAPCAGCRAWGSACAAATTRGRWCEGGEGERERGSSGAGSGSTWHARRGS